MGSADAGVAAVGMRIVLASSFVPFIHGGGRFIVEWLETKLRERGHEVERFYLPFVDRPDDLFDQILAFRLIDLSTTCDRLIALRPPAYVLPHPNKVLWFIHHIRALYDLWESPYRFVADTPSGRAFRDTLVDLDTRTILEARHVFTNSKVVAERLSRFNGIAATPLYPPILAPERFRNDGYRDEIVVVCRIEQHKRQWLLIEAMKYVRSGVRLRLCGASMSQSQEHEIRQSIARYGLSDRVTFENRWVSEDEKVERLAPALAVAYLPVDEDSYGYSSLEAAHAQKAVLTTNDSGGVLELVQHQVNGLVVPPIPQAIAEAMDQLYRDRKATAQMGAANKQRVVDLRIDWRTVLDRLTS
jgi:glycosyltransferase involved in cell wall biosynthesis